jgi:N-acylneuraminate cytidylyltransferase
VRAKKLGLEFRSGVDDKGLVVEGLQARMALQPKCVAFVGNDVNDLPAFERVGLRIAVGDAHSEVKIKADVVTQLPGGFGAVREVCDALFASRGGISPG